MQEPEVLRTRRPDEAREYWRQKKLREDAAAAEAARDATGEEASR